MNSSKIKTKYLEDFRNNFKISSTADLQHVAVAINSAYQAQEIGIKYLMDFDSQDAKTGLRVYTFINLASRIFEHAQAMLVALVTGSPASSEALGRIVVEGSINLMYLNQLGNASTIVDFFHTWVNEHEKRLQDWKSEISKEKDTQKIRTVIGARQSALEIYKNFIRSLKIDSCILDPEKSFVWPKKLFERFDKLGRKTDYFESYHRLSGSSHITGEDTMNWLMAIKSNETIQQKIAEEAWAYSIMMTRLVTIIFVESITACVISHGRADNNDLQLLRHHLTEAVESIAKAAGVPLQKN